MLTREQVRRVDRLAVDELGIPGIVLMENAGRNAAAVIIEELRRRGGQRAAIVCGTGNNGGDGFVVARHLANIGMEVAVALCGDPGRLPEDARVNHTIADRIGLPIEVHDPLRPEDLRRMLAAADVIVDGLLGTGFHGEVRDPAASCVRAINDAGGDLVVALDVPSGLDCDTGEPSSATVRADVTITFVAPKVGFDKPAARPYLGRVVIADIGTPPGLIERVRGGG